MKRWLLDTNALIWFFEGSPRMDSVKLLFSLAETRVYISAVSWWEIAIKARINKLTVDVSKLKLFVSEFDFYDLHLQKEHIDAYLDLPKIHKYPFDNMLLAQAITSPMHFITGDSILAEYSSLVMVI